MGRRVERCWSGKRKPEEAGKWTENEVTLMETLGDQLGVALESARLYENARRRAERERLTGEITAKVRSSNDPQVILQTAVLELRRALQASRAQVLLQSERKSNESEHDPQPKTLEEPGSESGAMQDDEQQS